MKGQEVHSPSAAPAGDAFLHHLAALDGEHAAVAAEDVRNEHGLLLLPKGALLGKDMAERLQQHKLAQPIDELVQVGRTLDSNRLYAEFDDLFARYPDFARVHAAAAFEDNLRHQCFVQSFPHTLMQRLTVLRQRLPGVFQRSLFCAWFGALIAKELALPVALVHDTFCAGLFHDIGMLSLPLELADKRGRLSDEEWHSLQFHVVMSLRLVAATRRFSREMHEAITEHHERCDGTGYPEGRDQTRLSISGQIVALADILFQMRSEQLTGPGQTLADALPYLRVNAHTYFFPTYQAVFLLLQKARLKPQTEAEDTDVADLCQRVQEHTASVQQLYARLQIFEDLNSLPPGQGSQSLHTLLQHAIATIHSAGLDSAELHEWLDTAYAADDADAADTARELSELDATLFELVWQARRVCRHGLTLLLAGGIEQGRAEVENLLSELERQARNWRGGEDGDNGGGDEDRYDSVLDMLKEPD